ncbi:hypothetical protein H4S08_004497 [Coemansia sp. RSA 1365]|nr:hypothetical protein H4S08_004497 [Coemansia sp. RSA 1365]
MKVAVSLFTFFVVTLANSDGGYITANYLAPAPTPSMSLPVYTAPQVPSNTGIPSKNPSNGYKSSVSNTSNYKSNVNYDNEHKHKHKNDDYDNDYKTSHGGHGHKNDGYYAKDCDYDKDDRDKVGDGNYKAKNNDYKTNSDNYKIKSGQESKHKHHPEARTSSITASSYPTSSANGYQTYN